MTKQQRKRTKLGRVQDYEIRAREEALRASTLSTIGECDQHMVELSATIADIETGIGDAVGDRNRGYEPTDEDREWLYTASRVLKLKRLALSAVQQRRGHLASIEKARIQQSRDRQLLDLLKETNPDAFYRLIDEACSRWPEAFKRGEWKEAD
jgi:hypothetical protein